MPLPSITLLLLYQVGFLVSIQPAANRGSPGFLQDPSTPLSHLRMVLVMIRTAANTYVIIVCGLCKSVYDLLILPFGQQSLSVLKSDLFYICWAVYWANLYYL